MKSIFWSFIVFLYFLIGAVMYVRGLIPETTQREDVLTIFRILFLWPTLI